jgi:glycerophosphoryl diester phosphodiesterase
MGSMKPMKDSGTLAALGDFRRTWPQLLLADLLARAFVVVVATPVIGLTLKLFLMRTETGVLSDADILGFLLHPLGLFALLLVLAIACVVLFFEVSQLMVIGFGAVENRRLTYLDGARYVFRFVVPLIELARIAVLRLLLLSAPFLAAVGGVYLLMLGEHDINFYLTDKPPEFWRAVALAGLILLVWAIVLFRQFATWLFALPMVLFDGRGGKDALNSSRDSTAGKHWKIAGLLACWILAVFLLGTLASYVVGRIGWALSLVSKNMAWLAFALGLVLFTSALVNLAVSIFGTSVFPLVVVRLYRSIAGPGRLTPEIAPAGSLGPKPTGWLPNKKVLLGGAVIVLFTVAGVLFFGDKIEEDDHAVVIAHRGASHAAPENTMASFEQAIEEHADWIELDVQENADGVVVVQHDSDFMKQARVPLKTWEATNEQLRDLDIGSWFAPEFADQRVTTLREVLELAKGKLGVFIELKYYGHTTALESKVVEIVEATEMQSSIVIMSLNQAGLLKAKALRPDWTYGLLTTVNVGDPTKLGLDFLAVNGAAAKPSLIRKAHARGMQLYVWTVNDPVQMSVMMSRGVDGLITDNPALVRRVQEIRAGLTPLGRMVVWVAGEAGLLKGWEPPSSEEDA